MSVLLRMKQWDKDMCAVCGAEVSAQHLHVLDQMEPHWGFAKEKTPPEGDPDARVFAEGDLAHGALNYP